VITTSPTATGVGTLTRVCENDHEHTETFTLPALSTENGYTYTVVTAPTCITDGTGRYTYTVGTETFTFDVTLPAFGHDFGEWEVTTAPTTTTVGTLTRVCAHDHEHIETKELPALSEENGYNCEVVTAPTCTEEGTGKYTYEKDGETFTFDVTLPATGHHYGDWTVTVVPTYSTTGLLTRVCTHDHVHKETFTLPKLSTSNGYTYEVIKAATCTNIGTGRYLYRRDGQAIVIEVKIPAIGHSFGDWALTHAPTATETDF